MAEATLFDLTQHCPRCQGTFGPDAFHPKKWGRVGSYCRDCATDYQRKWHARNPDYQREYLRNYYYRNKGQEPPARELPRHRVWFGLTDLRVRSSATGNYRLLQVHLTRRKPAVPTRPERLSYIAAHGRVRDSRGPARDHGCAECDKQAEEWAYDHADPNEIQGHTRRGRVATYSEDPDHYQPMCRSCHAYHDRAHWFAERLGPVLDEHGVEPSLAASIVQAVRALR